jgi:hypothetical protein
MSVAVKVQKKKLKRMMLLMLLHDSIMDDGLVDGQCYFNCNATAK